MSIGQGSVSVTPVSMAVYAATLANGGTRVTPHLLKAVDDGSGWKPVPPPPPQSRSPLDPDKLQAIRDGLFMVVNGAGTGHNAQLEGLRRVGQDRHGAGHFEPGQGAAPARPTRTCATTAGSCSSRRATTRRSPASCFLEHGVHGSNAALIAHHVLETFFAKKEGRPLPPKPEFKANLVPESRELIRRLN